MCIGYTDILAPTTTRRVVYPADIMADFFHYRSTCTVAPFHLNT
jgi:hypothetical protein